MKIKFKAACIISPIFIVSSILLNGCATLSPAECQTANWDRIGEQDGVLGKQSQIAQHYKACTKVNILPNQQLYESGYQKGLKSYCQATLIYNEALIGKGSYRVCPSSQHAQLMPFYNTANQFYEAKKKRDAFYKELDRYQDYLLDTELSKEKRDSYIKKIKELKREQDRIDRDYDHADRDRRRFERERRL